MKPTTCSTNENKGLPSRSTLSTMPSLYAETLAHLVNLAKQPGWKGQAWHRAKELEACPTRLWLGIKTDLTNHMKAQYDHLENKI
jgi:hypothetical protein